MHRFHKYLYIEKKDLDKSNEFDVGDPYNHGEFQVRLGTETTYSVYVDDEWFNLPECCEKFIKGADIK